MRSSIGVAQLVPKYHIGEVVAVAQSYNDVYKKPKPNNAPRKVVAYTGDGIRIFDSVKDVAEHHGLHVQSVYALINNGNETADGVSFDYQKWED